VSEDYVLTVRRSRSGWRIRITGAFDARAGRRLGQIVRLCCEARPPSLIVDCSDVRTFSSTALESLVAASLECRRCGIKTEFALAPEVRSFLDLMSAWWCGVAHDWIPVDERRLWAELGGVRNLVAPSSTARSIWPYSANDAEGAGAMSGNGLVGGHNGATSAAKSARIANGNGSPRDSEARAERA
jgi:anti-anti-sigma regulatory factor